MHRFDDVTIIRRQPRPELARRHTASQQGRRMKPTANHDRTSDPMMAPTDRASRDNRNVPARRPEDSAAQVAVLGSCTRIASKTNRVENENSSNDTTESAQGVLDVTHDNMTKDEKRRVKSQIRRRDCRCHPNRTRADAKKRQPASQQEERRTGRRQQTRVSKSKASIQKGAGRNTVRAQTHYFTFSFSSLITSVNFLLPTFFCCCDFSPSP